ncbi:MAG: DUF4339 domain-containing protein [Planctomycetaceae bacterium]|nr:DUF4339 domain-containing protein [Planctomycetaceae bacterium]
MGIRFHCPNGHRLNVKQFQAGQKGICPVCGVTMQIPLQSTRPSSKEAGEAATFTAVVDAGAHKNGDGSPVPALPTASARHAAGTGSPRHAPLPKEELATHEDRPSGDGTEANAVWYVRPASGGQFGPANADVIKAWLAEGRVGVDSLVWQQGWPEWRQAGGVFPQLSDEETIPGLEDIHGEPAVAPLFAHAARHHGRQRKVPSILVGWLATAFVILIVILSLILYHQYNS